MTSKNAASGCVPGANSRCEGYQPGHNTHWIHARKVGETPWGWRDGVITGIEARWITVDYVHEDVRLEVWHHEDLAAEVRRGSPVRVHEQYHVLGGSFGWVNVIVRGGAGPVPEPADPSTWAEEVTGGVQDMATGRALALDWRTDEG